MLTKSVLQEINAFNKKNSLFNNAQKILVAVSGGIDSMALLHALHELKLNIGIAHVNFNLRGIDSNHDMELVLRTANKLKIPVFIENCNTEEYCSKHKLSIQEGARKLRYDFFQSICITEKFDLIATAHNKNDQAETVLLNLIRGTGIKGLTGIPVKINNIIRPFLWADRKLIEKYVEQNKIEFRVDKSNLETKYNRNKIRNSITPILKKINPAFEENIFNLAERMADCEFIIKTDAEKKLKSICQETQDSITLSVEKLKKLHPLKHYLYYLVAKYGFENPQLDSIIQLLEAETGKQFFSDTHGILKNRKELVIYPILKDETVHEFSIAKGENITNPICITQENGSTISNKNIPTEAFSASFDADKIKWPLRIRKWKEGDSFIPLGMKGRKKISDFLIDSKVPANKKNKTWVLISGDEIIWVVGLRISDKYKITEGTFNTLILRYCPNND